MGADVFFSLWMIIDLLALVLLGRVIILERHNPKTEMTLGGAVLLLVLLATTSFVPLLSLFFVLFCIVEYPQHFRMMHRSIYKATKE